MNLFQLQETVLNSGQVSDFKIECDALTDADIECLAAIIGKNIIFRNVVGVPTGGDRIAAALKKYEKPEFEYLPTLIIDDVLTTGNSMEKMKVELKNVSPDIIGVVLFARGECPDWVFPLFSMNLFSMNLFSMNMPRQIIKFVIPIKGSDSKKAKEELKKLISDYHSIIDADSNIEKNIFLPVLPVIKNYSIWDRIKKLWN